MISNLREFVPKGDAAVLAAALLIALAVYFFLQTLVEGLIAPAVAAIFGEPNIQLLSFTVNGSVFSYGSVLTGLILLALALLVVVALGKARRATGSRSTEA